jgi:hypothetical protein
MTQPSKGFPRTDAEASALVAGLAAVRQQLNARLFKHPAVREELSELDASIIRLANAEDTNPGRHRSIVMDGTTSGGGLLAVDDVPGYDTRPDPLSAITPDQFMTALRRFRARNGSPSWRKIAIRAGQVCVHSTLYAAMKLDTLPKLEVVQAIVTGCGGTQDDMRAFVTAWRRISCGDTTRLTPA